jgi:hypothetical protein
VRHIDEKEQILQKLTLLKPEIMHSYHIISLALFGSFARGEQNMNSFCDKICHHTQRKKMLGAKYSRLAFWIWSIISMIISIPLMILSKAPIGDTEEVSTGTILLILFIFILPSIMWINALANRIRDYGSNPWLSLWALVPLVNIGMALYYGIVRYKENPTDNNTTANSDTSFTKAVYNHTKDLAAEVKPSISEYKQKHQTSKSLYCIHCGNKCENDALFCVMCGKTIEELK